MKRILSSLICALLILLFLNGCDAWTSDPDPLATQILDVRVEPNPVSVGETTTLTVIIRDSTASGLSYYWGGVDNGVETTEPHYEWTVNVEPGEYVFSIQVSRDGTYTPVQETFPVTIVAPE